MEIVSILTRRKYIDLDFIHTKRVERSVEQEYRITLFHSNKCRQLVNQ